MNSRCYTSATIVAIRSVDPLTTTHRGDAGWLWFGLGFVALWIGILAHEAAHFGVAALIHYCQHLEAGIWSSREQLVVVAVGPLTTTAVLVACAVRTSLRAIGSANACTALGLAAASRIVIVAPSILLGRGANDEITVAHILGVSPRTMWTIEFLLTGILVWTLLERIENTSLRRRSCGYMCAGIAVGWLSLFTIGRAIGLPI